MLDKSSYVPYGLEPIERASRDEITALQTERLRWTLKHAYDNVPAYRAKFDAAGVTPGDFKRIVNDKKREYTELCIEVLGELAPVSAPASCDNTFISFMLFTKKRR